MKRILIFFIALRLKWNGSPRKLQKAIKKADRLCKKAKKRYRVYFLGGKYQCLNRNQIADKKRSGEWSRNVNVTKMEPMQFYDSLTGLTDRGRRLLKTRSYGNAYNH